MKINIFFLIIQYFLKLAHIYIMWEQIKKIKQKKLRLD